MSAFVVKDSGERQSFDSGMVRDTTAGKVQYRRVLDGPMLERWAEHLTKGATKYPDVRPGVANWTLAAGEAEEARFVDSALRHFIQWVRGDRDEDHAAAVYFNVNGAEYVRARRTAAPFAGPAVAHPAPRGGDRVPEHWPVSVPRAQREQERAAERDDNVPFVAPPEPKNIYLGPAEDLLDGRGNR